MLDDKIRSELDQASAAMVEMLPPLWRRLYQKCIEVGFTETASLQLVKTYILSAGTNGIDL